MNISTIEERITKVILTLRASEGMTLALGISSLVTGLLVDVFVLRLLCLIVVLGSAVIVYASMRSKHLRVQPGFKGGSSLFNSQHEGSMMKKLIFDDFQIHAKEGIMVEEVQEEHSIHEPASLPTPRGSTMNSSASALMMQKVVAQPVIREYQISDFFDIDSDIYKGESEPRTEFDFLLNKVLSVIKEVLFANTVAFFWANREKQQMVLEARVTDSEHFMSTRRFPLGHDLVSKVAETGKPEFITEVNPVSQSELLRYYDVPEPIHSFIGVPVFFPKGTADSVHEQPVAVIAVDGKVEDEFGQETLALLGQFTKLISVLIKGYNDKYDLLLDAELLRSIRRLQERVRNDFSLNTIIQSLSEETSKLINWDFLSIVLYDESKHAWIAKKVTNRSHSGYILSEQAIDFSGSVVGQTIQRNTHSLIDDLAAISTSRFHASEKLDGQGSFLSVPISSLNKCYGAVNIESKEKFNFSRHDIEMLYRLAENSASALEICYMQEIINEYVIVDDVTGVYSKKFSVQRLDEELQRADDSGVDLAMLFISVDKAGEILQRFDKSGFERVMLTLAKAIRSSIRPYDIVGRFEENRFGVLLLDTAANDAYLWAEKIRKNISGLVINLDGKSFSITISAGVCGALEGMRKEELVGNTVTVLNRAAEAGGNVVRVF